MNKGIDMWYDVIVYLPLCIVKAAKHIQAFLLVVTNNNRGISVVFDPDISNFRLQP